MGTTAGFTCLEVTNGRDSVYPEASKQQMQTTSLVQKVQEPGLAFILVHRKEILVFLTEEKNEHIEG